MVKVKCLKNGAIGYINEPARPAVKTTKGKVMEVEEALAERMVLKGYAILVKTEANVEVDAKVDEPKPKSSPWSKDK